MGNLIHLNRFLAVSVATWLAACAGVDPNESRASVSQPEVRSSVDGVLSTTLEAVIAINSILDVDSGLEKEIETTTYEGRLTGPTLRLGPGDRLEEEWTVINRSPADHTVHIHQNPFLLTHVNGQPLPMPEWRDTVLVPAATGGGGNINAATFGTVTFRTYLHPQIFRNVLTHCHVLTHEDFAMMHMLELKPGL